MARLRSRSQLWCGRWGGLSVALLFLASAVAPVGTQAAATAQDDAVPYLDLPAMMLYPSDIEDADLGTMCVSSLELLSSQDNDFLRMERILSSERGPDFDGIDLLREAGWLRHYSQQSTLECMLTDREPAAGFYSVETMVMEQAEDAGAEAMFAALTDVSLLNDGPLAEALEYDELDAPDLGEDASLMLQWAVDNEEERTAWNYVTLTVRVDRLVGHLKLSPDSTQEVPPDVDIIADLGEVMVKRMADGLAAVTSPATQLLRLGTEEPNGTDSLNRTTDDQYTTFDGDRVALEETTNDQLATSKEFVDEYGYDATFIRRYQFGIDSAGDAAGSVLLDLYRFPEEDDATTFVDTRLDRFIENGGAEVAFEEIDLDQTWGDQSLTIVGQFEQLDGDRSDGYVGFLRAGGDVAFLQLLPQADAVDEDAFITIMDAQETCFNEDVCPEPLDVADIT